MPERGGLPATAIADRAGIRARTAPDTRLRRRRQCELIWRLGVRVLFELLDELDRHHRLGEDLDAWLSKYAAADLDLLGANRRRSLPTFASREAGDNDRRRRLVVLVSENGCRIERGDVRPRSC
jgi:hypothetical protein